MNFERHDGDAATIEDWLKVFEDTTGRDLTQFKLWYSQAGTPRLSVEETFKDGTFTLTFKQNTPPTPGQDVKDAKVIPIAVGLLSSDGKEVQKTTVLEMTQAEQSFSFDGLSEQPIPSILRDFSAPVIIERDQTDAARAFMMAHDTDPFNKFDAGDALARDVLLRMIRNDDAPSAAYLDGVAAIVRDDTLDPAFRALALSLPSDEELAQTLYDCGEVPDPAIIYTALETLRTARALHLQDILPRIQSDMVVPGPYSPDAKSAGKRSLGNAAMAMITRFDGGACAQQQFDTASNMTMQMAALSALLMAGKGDAASDYFRNQWREDRLVMDKWFSVTVGRAAPDQAAQTALRLTHEPDFDMKNPNRFRAVFGALSGNTAGFHDACGSSGQNAKRTKNNCRHTQYFPRYGRNG